MASLARPGHHGGRDAGVTRAEPPRCLSWLIFAVDQDADTAATSPGAGEHRADSRLSQPPALPADTIASRPRTDPTTKPGACISPIARTRARRIAAGAAGAPSPRSVPTVVVPGRAASPPPSPSPSPFPIVLKRPGLLALERDGRIVSVDPDAAGTSRTLVDGPDNAAPRWSPDGRSLAYVRGQGPAAELQLIPATGGAPRRLTANQRPEHGAAWSPRGDRVVYSLPRSSDPRRFDDPGRA